MKKLYAGYTKYQLLLFFLLKQSEDKVIFILPKYLLNIAKILRLKKYDVKIIEKEKPKLKEIISFILYYKYIKKMTKELSISKETILYGDSIINFILPDENILCRLEDGTGNYITKNFESFSTIKQKTYYYIDAIIFYMFFRKKLLRDGEKNLKRVNKYYATEMAPMDLEFEEKIERINLKKLWNNKTKEEKEEILDIFNVNKRILEEIKEKKIILFTQPLSEDGVIEEEEKIKLYEKILKKYNKEEVVIKIHPREKTKYEMIFKECLVIKEAFPSEILSFIGFEPKKAVTIFSGAVFGIDKNVEIDFYGTEIHKKLYEKFGSCDFLMKRSAFL